MSGEMPGSQPKMSPVQGRALRGNPWISSAEVQVQMIGTTSPSDSFDVSQHENKYYITQEECDF